MSSLRLLAAVMTIVMTTALGARAATAPLTDEQATKVRELDKKANAAYGTGDYAACAASFRELLATYAKGDNALYNMACCLALAGDTKGAMEALTDAIEAGFWNRSHMELDPDLEALRKLDAFGNLMERADRLAKQEGVPDLLATPGTAGGPYADIDAIAAHFKGLRKERAALLSLLGRRDRDALTAELVRDEAAALDALAASDAGQAEEARFQALTAMGRLDVPSATRDGRMDRFVTDYPKSDHVPELILMRAEADADMAIPEGSYDAKVKAMADASRPIVEKFPTVAGSRDAYLWLYREATLGEDRAGADALYAKLREHWRDDETFWKRNGYEFFDYLIRESGIPEFSTTTVAGKAIARKDLKGRFVLLDFWATWCGPCVAEIPHLKAAYEKFHDRGFDIVGISADRPEDTTVADFVAWTKEKQMPWQQVYDAGEGTRAIIDSFGVNAFPTTILLNREGAIVAVNLRGEELGKKLEEILPSAK